MKRVEFLSNLDIEWFCFKLNLPLIRCVSKNKLTKADIEDGGYVINMQDYEDGQGTHWVSLYIQGNQAAYFDSFGAQPPSNIINLLKGRRLVYSSDQVQHLDATTCGYYSLAFLHFAHKFRHEPDYGRLINCFLQPFDIEDVSDNDRILQVYIKRVFNHAL